MKRVYTLFFCAVMALCAQKSFGQAFTLTQDTVYFTPTVPLTIYHDNIIVPAGSPVMICWQVDTANSDFPMDWLYNTAGTSFCDNTVCPSASMDTTGISFCDTYTSTMPDFHMNFGLGTATSTGCYHMVVKFWSSGVTPVTTATATFMSCHPTMVPSVKSADEVLVYPNPATTSVNVVYDGNSDIRNVAIYNIIGKMMSIYKVSGNSANLNTENLSSGIYFLRLLNSHGDVVQTRKFTRQ